MQNPEAKNRTQEQQAIGLLKELLSSNDAETIREDLQKIFLGYITSDYSDYQQDRTDTYITHIHLLEFFTKIMGLKINI